MLPDIAVESVPLPESGQQACPAAQAPSPDDVSRFRECLAGQSAKPPAADGTGSIPKSTPEPEPDPPSSDALASLFAERAFEAPAKKPALQDGVQPDPSRQACAPSSDAPENASLAAQTPARTLQSPDREAAGPKAFAQVQEPVPGSAAPTQKGTPAFSAGGFTLDASVREPAGLNVSARAQDPVPDSAAPRQNENPVFSSDAFTLDAQVREPAGLNVSARAQDPVSGSAAPAQNGTPAFSPEAYTPGAQQPLPEAAAFEQAMREAAAQEFQAADPAADPLRAQAASASPVLGENSRPGAAEAQPLRPQGQPSEAVMQEVSLETPIPAQEPPPAQQAAPRPLRADTSSVSQFESALAEDPRKASTQAALAGDAASIASLFAGTVLPQAGAGAAPVDSAAAAPAALTEEQVSAIVDRILVSAPENGPQEIRITLGGREFSGTEISITRNTAGGLEVALTASSAGGYETLAAAAPALKRILETTEKNEVTVSVSAENSEKEDNDSRRQSRGYTGYPQEPSD